MKTTIYILALLISSLMMAQEEWPYYEIPKAPESYTAGTVAARMIDGLGFRYYWATEGLSDGDLKYKASESGRTSQETIDHIFGLSHFILNSISKSADKKNDSIVSFEAKRKETLLNFQKASVLLKNSDDVSQYDETRFPFWNIINGPIADALWHCGQLVMLRRASGNPFNSKVSLFTGTLKD